MDKKEYDKFLKRVFHSYRKITGRDYGYEDCAQWILLRRHMGKGAHQKVDQSVIDYLRTQWGHKRGTGYLNKFNLDSKRSNELKENHLISDPRNKEDAKLYSQYLVTKEYKVIFNLIVVWGFSLKEVAEVFDVTESLISQKFKKIRGILIKNLRNS